MHFDPECSQLAQPLFDDPGKHRDFCCRHRSQARMDFGSGISEDSGADWTICGGTIVNETIPFKSSEAADLRIS